MVVGTPSLSQAKNVSPASATAFVTHSGLEKLGVDAQEHHFAGRSDARDLVVEVSPVENAFAGFKVAPVLPDADAI